MVPVMEKYFLAVVSMPCSSFNLIIGEKGLGNGI